MPPCDRRGSMATEPARWSGTDPSLIVPRIEHAGRFGQHPETFGRIDGDVVTIEVLAPQVDPGVPRRTSAPSPSCPGSHGSVRRARCRRWRPSSSESCPRSAIEVVGAGHHPGVVDDAELGVDVDGPAVLSFEVVHGEAVASSFGEPSENAKLTHRFAAPVKRPSSSGYAGTTTTRRSCRVCAQRRHEGVGGIDAPQVLVFHVDERPRPLERLQISPRDAALTDGREGIRRALRRIGAQHLNRVGARPVVDPVPVVAAVPGGRAHGPRRASRRLHGPRASESGSSQRSRNVCSRSPTAGPRTSI